MQSKLIYLTIGAAVGFGGGMLAGRASAPDVTEVR